MHTRLGVGGAHIHPSFNSAFKQTTAALPIMQTALVRHRLHTACWHGKAHMPNWVRIILWSCFDVRNYLTLLQGNFLLLLSFAYYCSLALPDHILSAQLSCVAYSDHAPYIQIAHCQVNSCSPPHLLVYYLVKVVLGRYTNESRWRARTISNS